MAEEPHTIEVTIPDEETIEHQFNAGFWSLNSNDEESLDDLMADYE